MSIQFLGMIGHGLASEIIPASGPLFDKNYILTLPAPTKRRDLTGFWWATGPLNQTVFSLRRTPRPTRRASSSCRE